jgi:hypothetical protein
MNNDNEPTWAGKAIALILLAVVTVTLIEVASSGLMGLAGVCK